MSTSANRRYYLSRGRCPKCGGANPLAEGLSACQACHDRTMESQAQARARWRAAGLCVRCGRERDGGWLVCTRCHDRDAKTRAKRRGAEKALREERRAACVCTQCGKRMAEPGRKWCRACQVAHNRCTSGPDYYAKVNARRHAWRAAGVCTECGKRPAEEGRARCRRCIDMRYDSVIKHRIRKRIARENEREVQAIRDHKGISALRPGR